MKKLLLMMAAVAGLSLFAVTGTAEADHRCRGNSGFRGGNFNSFYGGYYGAPRGGFYAPPVYHGYYGNFHRGYGHGYGGFYGGHYGHRGPSFGIQTRGFGVYIR